jgi:DNA-binding response OmpR family regulator
MASILIIDDDKSILSFLKERLMEEGFNVLTATDGKEGMNLFNDNQVDLVITDIIMPDKDGFETIIELKRICPDIKIIAMSGIGLGMIKTCLKAAKFSGAEYAFAKPFETSSLLAAVYKLLKVERTSQCFNNSAL